ncbi:MULTISPECIES: hypothetical protein [unclassified Pseudomonas]|uniref:hypothetical protein n=1 Tax=Pseudomonas sp. Ant30-3 TaxID=1488328 RepID=UPI00067BF890|nr:hypothetical protein [Pseudomonas sp. Ant30-3]
MKSQLFFGIAFSVLAANTFAATSPNAIAEGGSDRLIESRIAADGSDRLIESRIAADGSDRLIESRIAADGSDRRIESRIAADGSDRLQQNRVALSPANAAIDGVLVADVRAEFGSKYQRY